MVQCESPCLDVTFSALADATRRGVVLQLCKADASISDLASRFGMTLTGMSKHIGVLEQAGLVVTQKVGRVRKCRLGPGKMEEAAAWLERYRQMWDARFSGLDILLEDLKRREQADEQPGGQR